MNNKSVDQDSYRSFQLMTEIESGESVSQRELAGRLGVAVGLVNSYLKNFVGKGYVRVKSFPRNRYGYLLTPRGLAEKSRLAYEHLNYFNSLYKTARRDYADLFDALSRQKIERVAFCGVDEVAEIAFLSIGETKIEVARVFADDIGEKVFFGLPVKPLEELHGWIEGPVVVTVAKSREQVFAKLQEMGLPVQVYCPGISSLR